MKNILIVLILLFTNEIIFSQDNIYCLSQDDLNLLLGKYIPVRRSGRPWENQSFSWGIQYSAGAQEAFVIDFVDKLGYSTAYLFGENNRNCLLIFGDGLYFLITEINKINTNVFSLSVSQKQNSELVAYGQLIISFLDDFNINVVPYPNNNRSWLYSGDFWKTAGPTVIQNR